MQLLLLLGFDVLVRMHVTRVLKVGPVGGEDHEEMDLEERGEAAGLVSWLRSRRYTGTLGSLL